MQPARLTESDLRYAGGSKEGSIMIRMLFKKTVAAFTLIAVLLSSVSYEAVFAATEDEPVLLTEAGADTAQADEDENILTDAVIEEERQGDASEEIATEEISEDTAEDATGAKADLPSEDKAEDETKEEEADGTSSAAFKGMSAKDRIIKVANKGTLEEAVDALPKTRTVTLADGSQKDVNLAWKCIDDFDDDRYSSFVFEAESAEGDALPDELAGLRMEIIFDDAVETDGDFIISRMSPNSLMGLLDAEQGTEGMTDAYTAAYGSGNEIDTKVSYSDSASLLPESAYTTFKFISPTPDNYLYNKLTTPEKSFYNGINNIVADHLYYGKEITLGGDGEPVTEMISGRGLNETQMRRVFYMYYYDNPQAFFLTTRLSIIGDSEYDLSMRITLYPDTATAAKLQTKAREISTNILAMAKTVEKATNEYNMIKEAQKLICRRLTFDTERVITRNWWEWVEGSEMYDKSIMSVFSGRGNKAIDGGYSKAFTAVTRYVGIDCFGINSAPANPRYANDYEWNKVRLYGEWFCADLTADDTDDMAGDGCTYEHFLKSDKTENTDHLHAWDQKWTNIAPVSSRDFTDKTKTYKIKYKLNGGMNSIYNPSRYTAKSTLITLRDPYKRGRKFKGWYSDEDYDHRVRTIIGTEKTDYTLFAKWVLIRYKIKYKIGKGAKNPKSNPKHYNAASKTIKLKNPTRKGYVFKGWYTDPAKTLRIKKIKGSDCMDYTLYAKWKLVRYKLNFKLDKGVINDNPKYYTIKTKSFALKDAVRPGYDFAGWYTNSGLTQRITKINTKPLKEYTLYAKWKIKTFNITYVLGGGKNNVNNPKKYNVTSKKIKLKNPTRTGYKFGGWYTDPAFTNRIKTIKPTDVCDYTLYAKWIAQ